MSGILLIFVRLLLIIALYSFFGWAFFVLWQDLRKQGLSSTHSKITPLSLYSDHYANEDNFQFFYPEIIVGRSPTADCTIDAEVISNRHARFTFKQNQWWVEDLKSTNGTYLNGEDILAPTIIKTGDIVSFGDIDFIVAIAQITPQR